MTQKITHRQRGLGVGLLTLGLGLIVLGQPQIYRSLTLGVISTMNVLRHLADHGNIRGYYEELNTSDLTQILNKNHPVSFGGSSLVESVHDIRPYVLRPLLDGEYLGVSFRTNEFGTVDNYTRSDTEINDPSSVRIALLGACNAMGWGVPREESFASRLEGLLDRHVKPSGQRVHLYNFAVAGYIQPASQVHFDKADVASIKPDIVLLYVLPRDVELTMVTLIELANTKDEQRVLPDYMYELLPDAIESKTDRAEVWNAAWIANREATKHIGRAAAKVGALPVLLYSDDPQLPFVDYYKDELAETARAAGFEYIDFSDIFENIDSRSMILNEFEVHPNAEGHKMLANAAYKHMIANPRILQRLLKKSRRDNEHKP